MATPLHANQQGRAEGVRGDTASPAGSAAAVPPVSAVNETSPTSQVAETPAPTVPPAAPDPQVNRSATAAVAQPASAPQPPGCVGGADPAGLEFVSDPEARWPPRLAAMICAGLVIWMAVGLVWPAAPVTADDEAGTPSIEPVSVAVRLSQAAPVTRMLRAEGVSKQIGRAHV